MALKFKMKDLIKSSSPANTPFLEKKIKKLNKDVFKAYQYFVMFCFIITNSPSLCHG